LGSFRGKGPLEKSPRRKGGRGRTRRWGWYPGVPFGELVGHQGFQIKRGKGDFRGCFVGGKSSHKPRSNQSLYFRQSNERINGSLAGEKTLRDHTPTSREDEARPRHKEMGHKKVRSHPILRPSILTWKGGTRYGRADLGWTRLGWKRKTKRKAAEQ